MSRRQHGPESLGSFSAGPFSAGVLVVCAALAASAAYSYVTLLRLQDDFLSSRAQDLISGLDARTRGRGPGGRADVDMWQSALDEMLQVHAGTVVFLEVVNSRGEVVARAGEELAEAFVLDRPLPTPRRGGQRGTETSGSWRIRAGLDRSSTAFISRAARAQAAVSVVAILTLITTAAYLFRNTRRFVALRAQEEAARHLADLGRLAATLAHEIRNPLGAVKGLTQIAREKIPADHTTQAHLQTVVQEAERLERLVTDLLRFARPRTPELSRFDLFDVALQARETVLQGQDGTGAEILLENSEAAGSRAPVAANGERREGMLIHADRDGVQQVLLNVLLNALQAGGDDARVRVGMRPAEDPEEIEIVIDDDGPGLKGRDPEELFSPFSTTKTRGSGLGLAVSRRIVEQLGGTIDLRDRPEGGARCTIVLPREPAEPLSGPGS